VAVSSGARRFLSLRWRPTPKSIANHATGARPVRACWGDSSDTGCSSRKIAFAILDLPITSRMLGVGLDGSRRI
jgi:hypothetical protein